MYEELFQTTNRPFRATPDVRFYFPFESMEQARQTVLRAVRRAEGPVAVMGGVGLGKSLLASLLAEDLADRFDVVRLHAARLCSRRAMLQNILFELQLPYRDLSEGELRLSLMERMEPSPAHAAEGLVLVVDEAQTLPTKLLEELRLITNFARQGQARARLVLLGGMQLEETLALPEMSSFNQRLAARCFLQPMNRVQTADFVRHQFTCSQVDPKQLITRDALENVYIASEGIPRLVNQVMDHALILAIATDQYPISASLIQEAWADLQQLPITWGQTEAAVGTPVEFGAIDDIDQDFELEPEGLDELEISSAEQRAWPAQADLEEFGPAHPSDFEVTSFDDNPPPHVVHNPSPRVVFDASQMFTRATPANQPSNAQPSNAQPADALPSKGLPSKGPGLPPETVASSPAGDQDMFVFREDQASEVHAEDATAVRNMFAAWNPPLETYSYEIELTTGPSPTDPAGASGPQPGIEYQLSDEGPGTYEASDYQLAAWPEEMHTAASSPLPMPVAPTANSHDPFGQDFDEEFVVEATDVRRWQERQALRQPGRGSAVELNDSREPETVANQQSPLSALHSGHQPLTELTAGSEMLVVQPHYPSDESFVATAGGTVDAQMMAEIEDLISQLNFSAFSVEMDSVEQISPEFIRQAAAAQHMASDIDQETETADVIPLRAAVEPENNALDDDRDLLVIEEDVPSSMRHAAPIGPPTALGVSYPDLFQQLRG